MTGHDNIGQGMDFNETQLKIRFERAVGDLHPEVLALVGAGQVAGAARRRKRRIYAGTAVAAVVALVSGGIGVLGSGLFDSDATGPADEHRTVVPLVPSTPRALAAATLTHLPAGMEPIAVGGSAGEDEEGKPDGSLFAELGYRVDAQEVDLQVFATPDVSEWDDRAPCENTGTEDCQVTTLPDGSTVFQAWVTSAEGPYGYAVATTRRGDQLVGVVEMLVNDSRASVEDLPFSLDLLAGVVADPLVGLSTSQDLVDAGRDIENWQTSPSSESGSGSSSSSAPAEATDVEPPTGTSATLEPPGLVTDESTSP